MYMGYEQWWKTLESLISEFRRKQIEVPEDVISSLKSAKTMITVYQVDPSCSNLILDIEKQLIAVESTLVTIMRKNLGKTYSENFSRKLEKARIETGHKPATKQRIFSRLPKDEHWIRILTSNDILGKDVQKIAEELGLSAELQEDSYILIHGEKSKIKEFVKRMAEECRKKRRT
jgi:hypothetical protein